jgi:molecular chaperone GrpE
VSQRKKKQQSNNTETSPEEIDVQDHEIPTAIDRAMARIAEMENDDDGVKEAGDATAVSDAAPVEIDNLEALREKAALADKYLNDLQYKTAEFDNFRKRTRKEKLDASKKTVNIMPLLDLMDNFDRTVEAGKEASELGTFLQALDMLHGQLQRMLDNKGIKKFSAIGETFDPYCHEAMSVENNPDLEDNVVSREMVPMFRQGEDVIRPAKVVVNRIVAEVSEEDKK